MKKLFVLAVAVFAYASSVNASNDLGFMTQLNERNTFSSVMKYIQADASQVDMMKIVMEKSAAKINAAVANGDEAALNAAVNFNLANARYILSQDQYRKYVTLINITKNNRAENHVILAEK